MAKKKQNQEGAESSYKKSEEEKLEDSVSESSEEEDQQQQTPVPASVKGNGKLPGKGKAAAAAEIGGEKDEAKKKRRRVVKKKGEDEPAKAKVQLFERVWSEQDEIVILEGLINFKANNGVEPYDMKVFHNFIEGSLEANVTSRQLSGKISKLKTKFWKKPRKLPTPHDLKATALCVKFWGPKVEPIEEDKTEKNRVVKPLTVKSSLNVDGGSSAVAADAELGMQWMKLHMNGLDLVHLQANSVLDAFH